MNVRQLARILLLLALAAGLAGCVGVDFSVNTSSGASSSGAGGGNASHTVNGNTTSRKEYKIQARAGQTIRISYTVSTERGAVFLSVKDRGLTNKILASRMLSGSEQDVLAVAVESADTYLLTMDMRDWGGSYALSWTVE